MDFLGGRICKLGLRMEETLNWHAPNDVRTMSACDSTYHVETWDILRNPYHVETWDKKTLMSSP